MADNVWTYIIPNLEAYLERQKQELLNAETLLPTPGSIWDCNLKDKDPFEIELEGWLDGMLDEPTVPAGTTIGYPIRSNFKDLGPRCECGSDKTGTPLHSTWCPKFKKF